jgi:hypothetical protein
VTKTAGPWSIAEVFLWSAKAMAISLATPTNSSQKAAPTGICSSAYLMSSDRSIQQEGYSIRAAMGAHHFRPRELSRATHAAGAQMFQDAVVRDRLLDKEVKDRDETALQTDPRFTKSKRKWPVSRGHVIGKWESTG